MVFTYCVKEVSENVKHANRRLIIMAWTIDEPFKLRHREGRCIEVSFIENKTKWISLKTNDIEVAKKLAYKMCVQKGSISYNKRNVTLEEFAVDFFDEDSAYTKKMVAFGNSVESYYKYSAYLKNYILPRFGKTKICEIKACDIEDWYSTLKDFRNGRPLANSTKTFILNSFSKILKDAVKKEYLKESPINYVDRLNIEYKNRDKIDTSYIDKMFPNDVDAMLEIWGDDTTALYFSILHDTGFRPGEALALKWNNLHIDRQVIYTKSSFLTSNMKYKNTIKTSHRGKDYKVGFMSSLTMSLLKIHHDYLKHEEYDFLFSRRLNDGRAKIISYQTFRKRLIEALDILEIDDKYTMYCLRHTFQSDIESKVEEKYLLELMGHTKKRKEYSHHTESEVIDIIENVKDLVVK